MKHLGLVKTAACAALLLTALYPRAARADDFNDRTIISFSNPVQVPGAILPAGTYVFKVLETSADRIVVQVSDEREKHVFATLIAVENHHMSEQARRDDPLAPSEGKTRITFYESTPGQPEAIKAWFYPSDTIGREFVYSKAEMAHIAK
jgi:hypothetical protein